MTTDEPIEIDDNIQTEPPELTLLARAVLTHTLSKKLATRRGMPWTDAHEARGQEAIAALVAAARSKGLETFTLVIVKPDGRRAMRKLSVDRISDERALQ